ncbi:MAG: ZPR1 zinc finger domain-containing protein [Thermoplasmata archaeon]
MDETNSMNRCPSCNEETLERGVEELDVPHFGKVTLYYMRCSNCGFRANDFSFEGDHPKEAKIMIKNRKDLDTKIVRGGRATVLLPELGLEIYPGPLSESFITNVEGLLNRFLDLLPLFDEGRKVEDFRVKIDQALSGKMEFSIILKDPSGVSHFLKVE